MGLSFLVIATCLAFGLIAAVTSLRPSLLPDLSASLKTIDPVKRFSPRNTLFIIGPSANHSACRMQRRLLKPAIPALICADISVMEIYGDKQPRKNGAPVDWLDTSLLRHAMNAEEGFYVIYVDAKGRTVFRREAPMVTSDILRRARLDIPAPHGADKDSSVLQKLRAA